VFSGLGSAVTSLYGKTHNAVQPEDIPVAAQPKEARAVPLRRETGHGLATQPRHQGPPRQRLPHAVHRGGDLGDFEHCPNAGLWILEIQIAQPSKPYGAFYEDLLA
jgi:hypothetical protein